MAVVTAIFDPSGSHDMLLNFRPHPLHRHEFTDAALDATVSRWAHALVPHEHDTALCGHCGGTGLVEHTSWATGATHTITCPVCGGED